jgi:hypothetical protein
MRARSLTVGLLGAAALLTAACGGGGSKDGATTSTKATTATTTPALPATFDWWAPQTTQLGHGWTVGPCAPAQLVPSTPGGKVLCLNDEDGRQAVIAHFRLTPPADGQVSSFTTRFKQEIATDRKAGCGSGYRIEDEPPVPLTPPDGDARRFGFTAGFNNAPDTERTVEWAGIRGASLVVLSIVGYDPGSCLQNTGQGSLADLRQLVPAIDRLVLKFGLPPLTP